VGLLCGFAGPGGLLGSLLRRDGMNLRGGQNLLQLRENLVTINRLDSIRRAKSSGSEPKDVLVADSIFILVVVLCLRLPSNTPHEFGGHFQLVQSNFDFLGIDRLAILIAHIDKRKSTLLRQVLD